MSKKHEKLVELRDLGIAVTLFGMGLLSILTPVRFWKNITSGLASISEKLPIFGLRGVREYKRLALSHPELRKENNLGRKIAQAYFETRMQIADQYLFKKWRPEIVCDGIDHIAVALKREKGVILWISPFAYSDLVAKMGLSEQGVDICHLSRPEHGFSKSTIGIATLNKLRTGIENRYIKDRIRISKGEEKRAMLCLRRALKKNEVVSITVGAQTRRPDKIPMANGYLRIATGAIRLSQMTGAAILPVFLVSTGAKEYKLDVLASLTSTDSDTSGVLARYGAALERYVAQYPAQWRGLHDFVGQ